MIHLVGTCAGVDSSKFIKFFTSNLLLKKNYDNITNGG